MGPRCKPSLHYEGAFEDYLRRHGLPYIAVDEAKKALFAGAKLKSFDFVVYRPDDRNLLVDVKGRLCKPTKSNAAPSLQNWATRQDIDDMRQWQEIFGSGFEAVFLFMYHWPGAPEKAPFKDLFIHQDRWYATLAIGLSDYREQMRARSQAWGTVHLPAAAFRRLARPFEEWL
ncbi:MAG: HYExAFE family protein [Phycisphaerae bacterium]